MARSSSGGVEPAVGVHVGEVGDFSARDGPRPVLPDADLEGAEALAEGDLLLVAERLLGEDQDGVAVAGVPHLAEGAVVERLREIEPADSRDEVSPDGCHQDSHLRPPLP